MKDLKTHHGSDFGHFTLIICKSCGRATSLFKWDCIASLFFLLRPTSLVSYSSPKTYKLSRFFEYDETITEKMNQQYVLTYPLCPVQTTVCL